MQKSIHLAVLEEPTKFNNVTSHGPNSNPECKPLNLIIRFIGFQGRQIICLLGALKSWASPDRIFQLVGTK